MTVECVKVTFERFEGDKVRPLYFTFDQVFFKTDIKNKRVDIF